MNNRIGEIVFSVKCFIEDYGEAILIVLGLIGVFLMLIYWLS